MSTRRSGAAGQRALRWVVAALGLANVASGLSLLLTPLWFYANVGTYAPYNRHFMGDTGAFVLALGVGLLLAAPRLEQHRLLLGVAVLGSALHAANHVVDDVLNPAAPPGAWLTNTLPLLITALLLAYVFAQVGRPPAPAARPTAVESHGPH